jgi:predicted nucleic acid-binding protein
VIHVDTSVLLDMLGPDPVWETWSKLAFRMACARDAVAVSDIVYAEISPGFDSVADVDAAIEALGITVAAPPRPALFLAGQAFREYRRQRGAKSSVLPDFLIGAHAAVDGAILLTRDVKRIKTYFPTVELISP